MVLLKKDLQNWGIKRDNAEIEVLAEPGTGFLGGVAWKQDGQDIYRRQTRAAGIRGERSQYCSRHHGGLKSRVHVEQTDDENIWIDVSGGKTWAF